MVGGVRGVSRRQGGAEGVPINAVCLCVRLLRLHVHVALKIWSFGALTFNYCLTSSSALFFCGALWPSQRPGFGAAVSRMNYDVLHQSQSYYSCSFALGRGSRGWMELLSDFTAPQRIYISEGPGCHAGARLCLTPEL